MKIVIEDPAFVEDPSFVIFKYEHRGESLIWDKEFKSWHLAGWTSLKRAAKLCHIPQDEVILLTLAYGP